MPHRLRAKVAGFREVNAITLKIPVMGFETTRDYAWKDGPFILFAAGDTGLAIKQQVSP